MNRVKLRNALTVMLFATIPMAYYAGGVVGFGKGYAAALYSQSADAIRTVSILRKLRTDDTKTPIAMLESQLDELIILNRVGRQAYDSLFNLPRLIGVGSTGLVDKVASSAVPYRAEFPSTAPSPLKASVDDALTELATRVQE